MSFTMLFTPSSELPGSTKAELEERGHYVHPDGTIESFLAEPDWVKAFTSGFRRMKEFDKEIRSVLIVKEEPCKPSESPTTAK